MSVRFAPVRSFHEPWLVWSPAFRRLERLGPAEAGTPSCQRFMVPMRGIKVVEATHEPENRRLADQRLTQIRFMVAMRPKKRVQTTHEPLFRSAGCQPAVSPIAN